MQLSRFRNVLLIFAMLLLIAGAILKLRASPLAWYFIIVAFVLYITARFFIRRK